MAGAIAVLVLLFGIVILIFMHYANMGPLESLASSGCGCLVALFLLAFIGLAILGMVVTPGGSSP